MIEDWTPGRVRVFVHTRARNWPFIIITDSRYQSGINIEFWRIVVTDLLSWEEIF